MEILVPGPEESRNIIGNQMKFFDENQANT
jgi:hypothetical protein